MIKKTDNWSLDRAFRRKYARYDIADFKNLETSIKFNNKTLKVTTLGLGGCGFYYDKNSLPAGAELDCQFQLSENGRDSIKLKGRLLYCQKKKHNQEGYYYCGVEFINPGHPSLEPLLKKLSLVCEDDQSEEISLLSIHPIVREALSNQSSILKTIPLILRIGDIPKIQGYRSRFLHAFQAVFENSIKFREKTRVLEIEVKYESDELYHILSIRDNGMGRDSKNMDLSVLKNLSIVHQGKCWAESQEDQGTTIFIQIPRKIPAN